MAAFGPLTILSVTAAAVAMAAQQTRDTRPPAAPATISGRVTERGTERPIPRIVVSLEAAAARLEAVTDADGRYEINDVPAGAYALAAAPEWRRSTYLAQRFGEREPSLYVSGPAVPNIELKAREHRTGADIALWRALGIEGRVLDPADQPLANVRIDVSRADGRRGGVRGAATNDLGSYRLYGLAPGRYRVCARVENQAATLSFDGTRLVRTCYVAATSDSEANDVVLGANDATGIDIRIQRAGTFTITGTVRDMNGLAVSGGTVNARSSDEHGLSAYSRIDEGRFVIKGVGSGRYLLSASAGGSHPGDPNPPEREREVGHAVVEVQGTDTSGVAIALTRPISVPGRVVFEGKGAPAGPGLRMMIYSPVAEERWSQSEFNQPQGAVGDDLRFELKEVTQLPRLVRVSNIPAGWALKCVRLDRRDITFDPANLATGSRLEVVLTNDVAKPSVRVVTSPGGPTAFRLFLVPADPARWHGLQMIPTETVRGNLVSLGAQIAGDYLLAAVSSDDAGAIVMDRTRVAQLATVATRITLSAGDERTFDVPIVSLPPRR